MAASQNGFMHVIQNTQIPNQQNLYDLVFYKLRLQNCTLLKQINWIIITYGYGYTKNIRVNRNTIHMFIFLSVVHNFGIYYHLLVKTTL